MQNNTFMNISLSPVTVFAAEKQLRDNSSLALAILLTTTSTSPSARVRVRTDKREHEREPSSRHLGCQLSAFK